MTNLNEIQELVLEVNNFLPDGTSYYKVAEKLILKNFDPEDFPSNTQDSHMSFEHCIKEVALFIVRRSKGDKISPNLSENIAEDLKLYFEKVSLYIDDQG